jgi:hypothetical protein
MPSAGIEPAIPATKRPQTYALDHVSTGIGQIQNYYPKLGHDRFLPQLSFINSMQLIPKSWYYFKFSNH